MRDAFLDALTEEAERDPSIMLLTADLGFGVFEDFESRFPGQFFNVGVAEQNMIGVATGLALEGRRVVVYSIGNFPTLRCLEQIRNDACYHEANITVVASGGGFSYGALGMSHHTTEDISILRALPGVNVVVPCTVWEAGQATTALVSGEGVGYLRIDKTAADDSNGSIGGDFTLGKARRLREGHDLTFLCTGGIAAEALSAAEKLSQEGIECRIESLHTVKPLDHSAVKAAVEETGGIITIEEHNLKGGLFGAIAECCLEAGILPKKFGNIGLRDMFSSIVGSQKYLRKHYEIDDEAIIKCATKLLS